MMEIALKRLRRYDEIISLRRTVEKSLRNEKTKIEDWVGRHWRADGGVNYKMLNFLSFETGASNVKRATVPQRN